MRARNVSKREMDRTARFLVGAFIPASPAKTPPQGIFRGEDADLIACGSCGCTKHRRAACPQCGARELGGMA